MSDIFDHEGDAWESLEPLGGPDEYYTGIAGGVFSKSYGGSSYRAGSSYRKSYTWFNYTPFKPDPLYYHTKLGVQTPIKETPKSLLLSLNNHQIWIPKKIIKYKDGEMYVHTKTFATIIREYKERWCLNEGKHRCKSA